MAKTVKNLPAMLETGIRSLGQEDPLEKGMATRSSAWSIPWTEEPVGLPSTESQRVGHNRVNNPFSFTSPQGCSDSGCSLMGRPHRPVWPVFEAGSVTCVWVTWHLLEALGVTRTPCGSPHPHPDVLLSQDPGELVFLQLTSAGGHLLSGWVLVGSAPRGQTHPGGQVGQGGITD